VVQRVDPELPEEVAGLGHSFDTVLCLNVLEYLDDPGQVVASLRGALKPNGVLMVLVPQGPALLGTLDRSLGHKRRYSVADARQLLESHGFSVIKAYGFNKAGTPPWWIYSKLFGSRSINKPVLKIFDKTVWLWRRLDGLMPWRGLSLIVIARREAAGDASESVRRQPGSMPELSSRNAD
jgi:SAM-dependent methyltransferase